MCNVYVDVSTAKKINEEWICSREKCN